MSLLGLVIVRSKIIYGALFRQFYFNFNWQNTSRNLDWYACSVKGVP